MVKIFNKDNFEDILKSEIPVLLDFSAKWCRPCQLIEPILEEVAREMDGKVIVGKIDIDENEEFANRFGIRSIPTMLIFSKGEVMERMVGITAKKAILEKLNNIK